MKVELKVTFELDGALSMTIEHAEKTIGSLALPAIENASEMIVQEGRNAIAGVFLQSITAASRAARKTLKVPQ